MTYSLGNNEGKTADSWQSAVHNPQSAVGDRQKCKPQSDQPKN